MGRQVLQRGLLPRQVVSVTCWKDLAYTYCRKRGRSHNRLSSPYSGCRVLEELAQDERHADTMQEKHDHLHEP
jgi:hypothetical protein